jgi:osmotically-inducible protein OsmY
MKKMLKATILLGALPLLTLGADQYDTNYRNNGNNRMNDTQSGRSAGSKDNYYQDKSYGGSNANSGANRNNNSGSDQRASYPEGYNQGRIAYGDSNSNDSRSNSDYNDRSNSNDSRSNSDTDNTNSSDQNSRNSSSQSGSSTGKIAYADNYSNDSRYDNNSNYDNRKGSYDDRSSSGRDNYSDSDIEKKIRDSIKSGWFEKGYDNVQARVNNGNVTLSGTVNTWDDKKSISKKVLDVKGVRDVNNQIQVTGRNSNRDNRNYSNSNNNNRNSSW